MSTICGVREPPTLLRLAWNATLATREHLVTFSHGHPPFRMLLRPSNYDADNWRRLLLEKEYVYHVALLRTIVSHFVPPEECVALDVGANSGYVSLAAASLGCTVVAAEANPSTARNARRSFALNGAGKRITLHNIAISKMDGKVSFAVRKGGGSIYDRILTEEEAAAGLPSGFHLVRVPSAPLHRALNQLSSPSIVHVAKLDCEGCEATAIETMAPLLHRGAVKVILSEWITSRIASVSGNSSLAAALATLERAGYRSLSWSGHAQPLATLADPRMEVGDLFLVHGSIAAAFAAKMQQPRDGMLAQWEALKRCRDRPH